MRPQIVIVVFLIVGCSRTTSDPPRVDTSPPPDATVHAPNPAVQPAGLYTDDKIRSLAKFDVDKEASRDRGILEIPCLEVVPAGESYPRAKVFKMLEIDDNRIRDFRQEEVGKVVFLTWQVSPSYDICCMTATNDRENVGLETTDPKRKIYGVRLVKR